MSFAFPCAELRGLGAALVDSFTLNAGLAGLGQGDHLLCVTPTT
jgi:hypothetical protein